MFRRARPGDWISRQHRRQAFLAVQRPANFSRALRAQRFATIPAKSGGFGVRMYGAFHCSLRKALSPQLRHFAF
jgi:hypothetical protein